MSIQLTQLLTQARRPKILVVGDVMLDRYLWGDVDRISPEAPIPVLKVADREERLGGAGSLIAILATLEADATLATVTADDAEGQRVRELLEQHGAAARCTLVAPDRTTTVKERLLGRTQSRHPQQIIRVDREDLRPLDQQLFEELTAAVGPRIPDFDTVLLSDYDKGVCATHFVKEVVAQAQQAGVPVIADPASGVDYGRYAGCTCITPNRTEAGMAIGRRIETTEQGLQAARQLRQFGCESVVVTLDRDGIAWAGAAGQSQLFPVHPRQVYDITGAGDTVLGALGFSLALGSDWPTAIAFANLAGGLQVQRLGVAPLTRRELLDELRGSSFHQDRKILTPQELEELLRERRRSGQQIVMTNGCFDLLHPGHVASLKHARQQGDCLVVGLNSDQSVAQLKGAGRPIIDQRGRAEVLATLECVDYVVIFDEQSVIELVKRIAPDVLVKSAEYSPEEVVGHEVVLSYGGRVVLAPMQQDYGTSELIARIQNLHGL